MDQVTAVAPATVSNVVCGFDCLGFALAGPVERITLRRIDGPQVRITHLDGFGLPTDPEKNVIGVVLSAILRAAGPGFGFDVEVTKSIRPGSGIGSSAASACGAAIAANHLLGERFSRSQLIAFALEGEQAASGSKHADNVAPCISGGFVLVRSVEPPDIIELAFPPLWATVVHPHLEIRTAEARALLPSEVPLADAVRNWSDLGAFVHALSRGDLSLMRRSMNDRIIEPRRSVLIPHFRGAIAAGNEAGAIGGGISGSGPSMFMLSETRAVAEDVRDAMLRVYSGGDLQVDAYVSPIADLGARVV